MRAELREFSKDRPRWGYRRAHHELRAKGWVVNRKRVQRLWREEGLRVPQRRRKRRRLGDSTVPASRLAAERPGHVWALDYQHDQTADGRVIRVLNVVDEFTREAPVMHVARSIDADTTVRVLERLVAERGAPALLRCDNGTELPRTRCATGVGLRGRGRCSSIPGRLAERVCRVVNGKVRDEVLNVEEFSCLAEARVVIEDWREDYNQGRPHCSLGMRSPARFRRHPGCRHRAGGRRCVTGPGGARAARPPQDCPSPPSATVPDVTSTTLSPVVDRRPFMDDKRLSIRVIHAPLAGPIRGG